MSDEQFETGSGAEPTPTDRSSAADPASAPTERLDQPQPAQTPEAPALPQPQAATGSVRAQLRRQPARLGTIVWGFLVVAFAAVVALTTDLLRIEDPTAWLIGGLVVGGAALVVAGIAASLRRAS
jgi:hypothetical protein